MKVMLLVILTLMLSFCLGWIVNDVYYNGTYISQEKPNPKDRILEKDIHVFKGHFEVDYPGRSLVWGHYSDTNSMDPVLDIGTHGIEVVPSNPDEIQVGDIISFYVDDEIIIHRVIELGYDNEWYALTKGDNLEKNDPVRIRFKDVHGVLIALVY